MHWYSPYNASSNEEFPTTALAMYLLVGVPFPSIPVSVFSLQVDHHPCSKDVAIFFVSRHAHEPSHAPRLVWSFVTS